MAPDNHSLFSQAESPTDSAVSTESRVERGLPGMRLKNGFSFRTGQEIFLRKLAQAFDRGEYHHLGVFVPGYGKTISALSSFVLARAMGVATKLVVFVPRGNLRDQYADREELSSLFRNLGAEGASFAVADSEKVFLKNLSTEIIITTYQYASGKSGANALRTFCDAAPCMFVFDEVHHLAEDGTWATVIETFRYAASIGLSGTPIRSDNKTLLGVPMERGENGDHFYVALHEVTLRDAHAEGRILKKVEAHIVDYHLTMQSEETGELVEMTLSELAEIATDKREIDAYLARRKLRFHDVYLETLLDPAFRKFSEKRDELAGEGNVDRNHQMLVIAMSNAHAAAMLQFIKRRYPTYRSTRIGQDVPARDRRKRLDGYRRGEIDVMVQVDMIGEGTDIKPISLIVKADLVRAWSKTLQQVFRGMRYYSGFTPQANMCDIYSADDSQVVATLRWVTAEFRAGVRIAEEREREGERTRGEDQLRSVWDLRDVQQRDAQTHVLDLFGTPQHDPQTSHDDRRQVNSSVVDVGLKEEKLRRDCAALTSQLSFMLEGRGERVEPKMIHYEAMKRFAKNQGSLSLRELEKKKLWLERCLSMRKIV